MIRNGNNLCCNKNRRRDIGQDDNHDNGIHPNGLQHNNTYIDSQHSLHLVTQHVMSSVDYAEYRYT